MSEILIQPIQSTYSITIGELGQKNNIGVQQIVNTVEACTQINEPNGQTPIPNDDWNLAYRRREHRAMHFKDVESIVV